MNASTVKRKLSLATLPTLSRTVTVTTESPTRFVTGVSVSVRLLPEPPRTTLASGSRFVFDELTLRIRDVAGVSTSPTVNAIGATGAPGATRKSAMVEIVGFASR